MSTPVFLLGAVLTGVLIGGAMLLLGRLLEPLAGIEAQRRRLQRRLDARMARGTDLYFEELRSIEAGFESNDKLRAMPSTVWWQPPHIFFLPPMLLFLGIWLLTRISESLGLGAPPYWTHQLGWLSLAIVGLAQFNTPQPVFGRRATWILGALFLVFAAFQFADTLPFYLNPKIVTE